MRVLFLTQFFPPEIGAPQTRILETARNLQDLGHEVAVLTSFPNYPSGIIPEDYRGKVLMREDIHGIPVLRAWLYASPNRGFSRRSVSHLSFALSALPAAGRLPWRPDVISVDMHPLFLCATAACLGRIWNVPFVLNAGDLIPEQAVAYGVMKNPVAIRVARTLANFALTQARQIVPFTAGIRSALAARGIPADKVELIYFGADTSLFKSVDHRQSLPHIDGINEGSFVVTYAGTHGLPHGLDVILDAARILRPYPDIQLLMVGDGGEKARLVDEARQHGIDNVTFLDPLARSDLPTLYRRSDVCLVTLRRLEWLRQNALSSKVFDAMAAGRPIIVAAEGETERFVRDAAAGICIPPESPRELSDAILRLRDAPDLRRTFGENGRRYIENHLTREQQSRLYEAVLRRAVDANSGALRHLQDGGRA